MADNLDADGLLQRFIPMMGNGIRTPGEDTVPDAAAQRAYEQLVRDIGSAEPVFPDAITLSQEAHVVWAEFGTRLRALMELPNMSDAWRGHLGKWPGISSRLLLLLHVVDSWDATGGRPDTKRVSTETARRGVALGEWLASAICLRFYEECEVREKPPATRSVLPA